MIAMLRRSARNRARANSRSFTWPCMVAGRPCAAGINYILRGGAPVPPAPGPSLRHYGFYRLAAHIEQQAVDFFPDYGVAFAGAGFETGAFEH